jgi:hypothetical protein
LAGSISAEDVEKFHRLLFRATKGNLMFSHKILGADDKMANVEDEENGFEESDFQNNVVWQIPNTIIDPRTMKPLDKAVFFLFFQSGLND